MIVVGLSKGFVVGYILDESEGILKLIILGIDLDIECSKEFNNNIFVSIENRNLFTQTLSVSAKRLRVLVKLTISYDFTPDFSISAQAAALDDFPLDNSIEFKLFKNVLSEISTSLNIIDTSRFVYWQFMNLKKAIIRVGAILTYLVKFVQRGNNTLWYIDGCTHINRWNLCWFHLCWLYRGSLQLLFTLFLFEIGILYPSSI